MIINHNISALNTYRQLTANSTNGAKSLEKLSSGLRINKAGDDAAGLAISEKMRAQIRGLDQASRNAQDGISMIQTAEGGLNETHAILQRMRELANQAANDTNVGVDRNEIQKEMNQLSTEINRIGNTTEFNTQSLLKGDGKANLTTSGLFASDVSKTGTDSVHTQAKATVAFSTGPAVTNDKLEISLNGIELSATFVTNDNTKADSEAYDVTGTSAKINIAGTPSTGNSAAGYANAINAMIETNDQLKGNYKASVSGDVVTIEALAGGAYEGSKGNISGYTETVTTAANFTEGMTAAVGTTASPIAATENIDFSDLTGLSIDSKTEVEALVGKGFTINGQQVEFYNANDGGYKGNAFGVNISDAINATANFDQALAGTVAAQLNNIEGISAAAATSTIAISTNATGANAKLEIQDGGTQTEFKANFQVGANKGQSMTIEINDMRAGALGITAAAGTAGFIAENAVTNGTDNVASEAALDVSKHENATAAIKVINDAIETVSAERSKMGAYQNRLEHTINNLGTSSENLTAAESRVRDVDMAKEMMEFTKNNILSQAAQAMLAQANQQPQGVLQLLR